MNLEEQELCTVLLNNLVREAVAYGGGLIGPPAIGCADARGLVLVMRDILTITGLNKCGYTIVADPDHNCYMYAWQPDLTQLDDNNWSDEVDDDDNRNRTLD